jgi:hypothetical protein
MRSRICRILALAFVFAFSIPSDAATPTHLWSQRFGDTAKDVGHAVAVDASGNVFIAGSFQGTADYGGGSLVSAGLADVFLAKYDAGGGHQWSKRFGSTGTDVGWALAVDPSGHVVVTGSFSGTVDFGGGPVMSTGSVNAFAAKYDTNGLHVWSRRLGGSDNETAYAVTADVSGNIIVTGDFVGSADFGGGPLVSAGWRDIFVVKYDANGAHQWSQRFGSGSADTGLAVAVDATGSVFVAGEFQLTVDFGGGSLVAQGMDVFVAKYDANGAHQWSQRFGDAVSSCLGMVADASGRVVLTGFFSNSADFGGGTLTTAGDVDIFLVKFDGNGAHQWSRRFGGASYETGYSVAVDVTGNVFLTGDFRDTVNFGGSDLASAGRGDIFVAKYNASGVHEFSERFGDTGDDTGHRAAVDATGNVIVTGSFDGTVDFGGGPLTSAGASDIFFAKYRCMETRLDIKPGSCPNLLNVHPYTKDRKNSKQPNGVFPVALLGSEEFNVHDVDVSSLRLGGVMPLRHSYEDVSTVPSNGDGCECNDHGADGYMDLTLKFSRAGIIGALGGERGSVELTLTGNLNGGEAFEASDCVWVVNGRDNGDGPSIIPERIDEDTPVTLKPAIPNPFNPVTRISYSLSEARSVRLVVHGVRGERVAMLVSGRMPAGEHVVTWDASGIPNGVYFYRIESGAFIETRKMILLK